jgi:hypothetical protein
VAEIVCIIPLTRGKFAIIDPEDYDRVSQHTWSAEYHHRDCWYATTVIPHPNGGTIPFISRGKTYRRPRRTHVRMHKFITEYERTDHENGDGLDNRRINLRVATALQNSMNTLKQQGNVLSDFKGVSWYKYGTTRPWRARITVDGREKSLGYFPREIDAARAYDEAAVKFYGEFAKTNRDLGLLS